MDGTSDKLPVAVPAPWRWLGLLLLLAGFAALVGGHVSSIRPEPQSKGVRLTDWLRHARYVCPRSAEPDAIALIEGFGKAAIPLLIAEYHGAGRPLDRRVQWLIDQLPGERPEKSSAAQRRLKALFALAVLGRRHPELVMPVFATVDTMSVSGEVIPLLGKLGRRYLPVLTNLVATGSQRSAGIAIEALSFLGTNAQSAVPLVLAAIEKQWRSDIYYGEDAKLVQRMGRIPPEKVEAMLILLNDSDANVRACSAHFLARLTNHVAIVAPEMQRLAGLPMSADHDPGFWVVRYLPQLGVPAAQGVPLLLLRLRVALDREAAPGSPESAFGCLEVISRYGAAAREAIPLVDKGLYPVIKRLADPARKGDPDELRLARRRLDQLEQMLRKIDPGWKPAGPAK